ncbi:MAG: hypothetical protein R2755_18355 [Acidimicrobiales bacterium]
MRSTTTSDREHAIVTRLAEEFAGELDEAFVARVVHSNLDRFGGEPGDPAVLQAVERTSRETLRSRVTGVRGVDPAAVANP